MAPAGQLRRRAAVDRLSDSGSCSGRSLAVVIGMSCWSSRRPGCDELLSLDGVRVHVPERPNLAFTGKADGHLVRVLRGWSLLSYAGLDSAIHLLNSSRSWSRSFLSWMILRWVVGELSSNGQPLTDHLQRQRADLSRLARPDVLSFITIIGWAWVITAWMRWICRNIGGTRREIVFNGAGLEMLWRTLVFGIGCAFIIPIPWVLRWYRPLVRVAIRAGRARSYASADRQLTCVRAASLPARRRPPACRPA